MIPTITIEYENKSALLRVGTVVLFGKPLRQKVVIDEDGNEKVVPDREGIDTNRFTRFCFDIKSNVFINYTVFAGIVVEVLPLFDFVTILCFAHVREYSIIADYGSHGVTLAVCGSSKRLITPAMAANLFKGYPDNPVFTDNLIYGNPTSANRVYLCGLVPALFQNYIPIIVSTERLVDLSEWNSVVFRAWADIKLCKINVLIPGTTIGGQQKLHSLKNEHPDPATILTVQKQIVIRQNKSKLVKNQVGPMKIPSTVQKTITNSPFGACDTYISDSSISVQNLGSLDTISLNSAPTRYTNSAPISLTTYDETPVLAMDSETIFPETGYRSEYSSIPRQAPLSGLFQKIVLAPEGSVSIDHTFPEEPEDIEDSEDIDSDDDIAFPNSSSRLSIEDFQFCESIDAFGSLQRSYNSQRFQYSVGQRFPHVLGSVGEFPAVNIHFGPLSLKEMITINSVGATSTEPYILSGQYLTEIFRPGVVLCRDGQPYAIVTANADPLAKWNFASRHLSSEQSFYLSNLCYNATILVTSSQSVSPMPVRTPNHLITILPLGVRQNDLITRLLYTTSPAAQRTFSRIYGYSGPLPDSSVIGLSKDRVEFSDPTDNYGIRIKLPVMSQAMIPGRIIKVVDLEGGYFHGRIMFAYILMPLTFEDIEWAVEKQIPHHRLFFNNSGLSKTVFCIKYTAKNFQQAIARISL